MSSGFITFILIVAGIVASYYLLLYFAFKGPLAMLFHRMPPVKPAAALNSVSDFPVQLIDRPAVQQEDMISLTIDKPDNSELQMVEDEDSHLLKAAEIVVENVQDVVNHIASRPPNPDEVFSKIRAIVNQYSIFQNTDYFEAINSFIAITVERDCGLQFSHEELLGLWK